MQCKLPQSGGRERMQAARTNKGAGDARANALEGTVSLRWQGAGASGNRVKLQEDLLQIHCFLKCKS
eukprot:1342757-Pleurochrysis_carterae.AAC.6